MPPPDPRESRTSPDLVRVLEAAYAVDLPEPEWLKGLIDAMRPAVEDGLGMAAYVYDTADRPFRIRHLLVDGCPVDEHGLAALQDESNDDFVRNSWVGRAAMMASETPGYATHPGVTEVFHPAGIRDILVVNALDPIGVGCWIGAPLRNLGRLEGEERERWNRVAAHVRASLRLRLRLAARASRGADAHEDGLREGRGEAASHGATSDVRARNGAASDDRASDGAPVEAILRHDGTVEHVESAAEESRSALRDAVLGIQRAKREFRDQPDRALPSWKAMVRARWTLVDDFQADGGHYIVARVNAMSAKATERLSWRERQVVACLSMGQTNKEVAYELGLSHSTVRVLVARACAKLGVETRGDLVAKYRRDALE